MKNLLNTSISLLTLLFTTFISFGQGQYDAIKKLGEGEYEIIDVKEGKVLSQKFTISFRNSDDPKKFYCVTKFGGSKSENYTMDEVAYGASLINGGYIADGFNYTRHRDPGEDRLIVIDETIYYLQSFKGLDKPMGLYYMFRKVKEKKKMTLKEQLKAELSGDLNKPKIDHEQVIKDFLKKELEAQAAVLPDWKAANQDYYEKLEEDKLKYSGMLDEDRKARAALRNTTVRITNNTGQVIYIRGNIGFSTKIDPGSFDEIDCDLATLYKSNSSNTKGAVLFEPSEYCGGSFVVSSW